MQWVYLCLLLIFPARAYTSIINQDVRAVAVLLRHGERTPSTTYPGDPYIPHFDQIGWGKLTSVGCHRLYSLGSFLGKQFPQLRERSLTKLKSSAYTRSIDSVKCLMHGLGEPNDRRDYNLRRFNHLKHFDSLRRSKLVIETLPLKEDPLLNHAGITCERRDFERKTDENIASLKIEYKQLFNNLSQVTGEVYDDPYFVIGQRIDPIKIEKQLGLQLPSWVTDKFLADAVTSHDKLFTYLGQLEIEKKLSGVFLQELIQQFKRSARQNVSLFVYGSHDTTLASIMNVLGMWQGVRPKNGEALIFTFTNDDQIAMFYYHQNMTLTPYVTPGCQLNGRCFLSHFALNVSQFILHDWREECQLK